MCCVHAIDSKFNLQRHSRVCQEEIVDSRVKGIQGRPWLLLDAFPAPVFGATGLAAACRLNGDCCRDQKSCRNHGATLARGGAAKPTCTLPERSLYDTDIMLAWRPSGTHHRAQSRSDSEWEKIRYHFYHFKGQLPLVTAAKCASLRVSANAVLFYNAGCRHPLRHALRWRVSGLRNRRLEIRILWGVLYINSSERWI